ncbi:MAG: T9SS type A sorting domain-containing protein [Elusimicrobia bacterium]|nr:T9SS type A sorting domain-containing protein [Elusimicrobiota bacterium]
MVKIVIQTILLLLVAPRVGAAPVISVDLSQTQHTISPLLFGDQIQWPNLGQDLLKFDLGQPTGGVLRLDVLDQLRPAGLTLLRYPGGTLSDFFHWSASTGLLTGRSPQPTLELVSGTTDQLVTQVPLFGADEFAQVTKYLGTEMMITVNVGSGTASEAAAWLSYYKGRGVQARYWEIGNEVYITGDGYTATAVRKTALQYAALFDQFAQALRSVDPDIQVGMIGCHDSGALALCYDPDWNKTVLSNISQKVDFIAVHNSYAPAYANLISTTTEYQATLAAPDYIRTNFNLVATDIDTYAPASSKNMKIAVTEHASFWLFPAGTTDPDSIYQYVSRNKTLGSALFSALSFHVFMSTPRIAIANHINPLSAVWQAPLTVSSYPASYPNDYDPQPFPSAYYHVFRLYADAAGGAYLPAAVTNSPTFDSQIIGVVPAQTAVRSLDAIAVKALSPQDRIYVYVVNRDLIRDITATVILQGILKQVTTLTIQQLTSTDYTDYNTHENQNAVQFLQHSLAPSENFSFTFPAYSFTRFTFDQGMITTLGNIQIFPNPLRPARGHAAMIFSSLPPSAHLSVYTLAGELVKDLTADANGTTAWDGTNQAGQKAASGVYLVLVQGANDKKTFKVAIQR